MAEGPNSRARKLACPSRGHRVTVVLPRITGGLGMPSGLGTPLIGFRKEKAIDESHEETKLRSNMK